MKPPEIIPTGIVVCCRKWVVALGYRWGRCGICGEHPTFVEPLPESEWITPRAPIDQRSATLDHNTDEGLS